MARTPGTLRRTPLALVTSLFVTAALLGGVAANAASTVRKFSVTMPSCVKPSTTTTLTATITNSSTTTAGQKIGSIFLDSPEANFGNITPASAFKITDPATGVVRTDWTGKLESAYGSGSDRFDLDGLYLVANNSGATLAPGASISVNFPVTVKSPTGLKPFSPSAWTGLTPNTGSSFSLISSVRINVTPTCTGAIDHFNVQATSPQTAGGSFPVTITAQDAANVTVASYTGSKAISFSGPGNAPDGTQPLYPTSVNFSSGVGNAFVTLYKAESTTLTAKDGTTTGSAPMVVNPKAASKLVFSTQPGGAVAGAPFTTQPVVMSQDQYGNDSTVGLPANDVVTVSLNTGTGVLTAPSGSLTQDIGTAAGNGTASFSGLQVNLKGAKTLTAHANTVLSDAISGSFTVGAGGVASFQVDAPSSATAGTSFEVTITALDGSGNAVDSYAGAHTLTFSGPGDSPLGSSPDYPVGGIVTFDSAGIGHASITLKKAETTQLTVKEGSSPSGTSGDIVVGDAGVSSVAFTQQPTNTIVQQTMSQVDVTVTDTFGNPVSVSITLSISPDSFNPTPSPGLTGGGPVATDPDTGVASFSNLKIGTTSSGYMLRTDVMSVDSSPFAITNTDTSCTSNCTADLGGGSTVTAPSGTTLIVENNPIVTCGSAITDAVAGTVTIIPDPSGPNQVTVTFFDPYAKIQPVAPGNVYPVCKGTVDAQGNVISQGNLVGCTGPSDAPCIESQTLSVPNLDMTTVIRITKSDPPVRH